MAKHGRSSSSPQSQDKRTKVQGWLMQEGWQIAELPVLEGALWVIQATNSVGHVVLIIQPAHLPERLDIQGNLTIGPEHQRMLGEMNGSERQDIIWKLRFDLLQLKVDFGGFTEPLTNVFISQRIYNDGLTRDRFLQRITQVKAGIIMVIWSLNRHSNQPPDALDADFVN
jgi:hypothetical protein